MTHAGAGKSLGLAAFIEEFSISGHAFFRLSVCSMLCNMRHMARGQSGRLVLEIDPAVKRALHSRLASEGRTLKSWFLEEAQRYLNPVQQVLPLAEPVRNDYGRR